MTTPVYWNNLNLTNDWADALNWSFDTDGTSPLGGFSGDEYFLWEGTSPGASDDCNLSSPLTLYGLDMDSATCAISSSAGAQFTFLAPDSSSPGGTYVALFAVSAGGSWTSGGYPDLIFSGANTGEPYTILGVIDVGHIQFDGITDTLALGTNSATVAPVGLQITVNSNYVAGAPIRLGDDAIMKVDDGCFLSIYKPDSAPAIVGSGGDSTLDLSASIGGTSFNVFNCDTSAVLGPDITTILTSGSGGVTLSINRGPLNSSLPQWAVDQTNSGGVLNLNFSSITQKDASTIAGSWTNLDIMNGGSWHSVGFRGQATGSVNVAISHVFAGATAIAFSTEEMFMSCGSLNTTAHRIYSLSNTVTVTVTVNFDTSGIAGSSAAGLGGNIQFGLSWGTTMTVQRCFCPGIQGWDGTIFPRNVVLAGTSHFIAGDVALGTNAYFDTLSCTTGGRAIKIGGGAAVNASPGSLVMNLTGKLNFPANDISYWTSPVGTYRINLGTGANAAAVIALVGAITPVP